MTTTTFDDAIGQFNSADWTDFLLNALPSQTYWEAVEDYVSSRWSGLNDADRECMYEELDTRTSIQITAN